MTRLALTLPLTLLLSAGALSACSEPTTPPADPVPTPEPEAEMTNIDMPTEIVSIDAQMMVGDWSQETPFEMTSGDQTFTIMNGWIEYDDDGTSEVDAMLVVDGQPDTSSNYRIEIEGFYTLVGDALTETFTSAEVEPVINNDTSQTIAAAIEDALEMAGATPSIVDRVDEQMLIKDVEGIGQIRYSRP